MASLRYMTDYHTVFEPKSYLDMFDKAYKVNKEKKSLLKFRLKAFHDFWLDFQPCSSPDATDVRCLEFGGGPSVANLISASPKVDCIVFAEYVEANREAVRSWIAGSPTVYKWSTLVDYVLRDIEAKGEKVVEAAVSNREDELRQKIKSVVPCDVTKTPMVELEGADVGLPFDVVSTSLCLEVCAASEKEYKSYVAKLCNLLKPNGYLCMYGSMNETFYAVANERFHSFPVTRLMVEEAMKEGGIQDVKIDVLKEDSMSDTKLSNCQTWTMFFARGRMAVGQNK